ncbi:hypothetical protein F2Q69_00021859 [Brassica cretica]|uniref:Uncharacterized protein n=1 Tax=Brassica cretica TaxID=69181 RepID=A0A8S9Q262_BRACR|nr:hypothetical protein F2Q69_00021859 [Brassica cretica]
MCWGGDGECDVTDDLATYSSGKEFDLFFGFGVLWLSRSSVFGVLCSLSLISLSVERRHEDQIQCASICFGTLIRTRRYRRTLIRSRLGSSSCPPDQLQPQHIPDPRRTQLHPTSRTARDPTATAPVRIRAARDPIEAARVPASSRPDRV